MIIEAYDNDSKKYRLGDELKHTMSNEKLYITDLRVDKKDKLESVTVVDKNMQEQYISGKNLLAYYILTGKNEPLIYKFRSKHKDD